MMDKLKKRLAALEKTTDPDALQNIPAAELEMWKELYPDEYAEMMRMPPEERLHGFYTMVGNWMEAHI